MIGTEIGTRAGPGTRLLGSFFGVMGGISVWGKLWHSIQIGPKNTRSVYGVLNIQYQKADVCLLLTIVCYVFNVSISGKK